MKITKANGKVEYALIDNLKKRSGETDQKIIDIVTTIINEVKANGDEAVREYTVRFDGGVPKKTVIEKDELQDYLNRRRVSEAQKLMAQENMSLFYIADAVGYQDFSTFYRNFKRCCGMSPSQYREIVLGQAKADISNEEEAEDKTE